MPLLMTVDRDASLDHCYVYKRLTYQCIMITLPTDCLYQIFQHFKDDLKTLHSCLLSNRTCCELIIPILWSNPWKLIPKKKSTLENRISLISLLSTILSCLPSESKQLLHEKHVQWKSHKIFLNYITYCRSLDFHGIWDMLDVVSAQDPQFSVSNFKTHIKNLVGQEICKMIILQSTKITQMIIAEMSYLFYNLFRDLSLNDSQSLSHLNDFEYEINEDSNLLTFNNLSNVCKNISNFTICLRIAPNESFNDLIKSQNSIKFMNINFKYDPPSKFINSLLLHANTLTHLYVSCNRESTFSKIFSVHHTFSNLRFLKYHVYNGQTPFSYYIIAQIIQGTQGKLERLYMSYSIYYTNLILNQSILRSCQNLKVLTTFVTKDTLNIILEILTSCRNLEGIALYSRTNEIYSILNHLSLHPLKNLYNLKFNIIDSCWNFSTKNLKLFLKSLEKEELVKKINISLIYKQIDIYLNKIIDLFETYYLKGIIASYFIEDENDVIYEYDDWQRLLI
ncbi:44722_t:CDS:2 [Gigaspora margarita]|uniref:44722_t:CDS:1 n=1 Tax=Gigaspora margarita TaxID=4874 RepID=A0ABN7VVP8_GIGMA|nr:44722_t:CDS:2 [Gigaspora margarita]